MCFILIYLCSDHRYLENLEEKEEGGTPVSLKQIQAHTIHTLVWNNLGCIGRYSSWISVSCQKYSWSRSNWSKGARVGTTSTRTTIGIPECSYFGSLFFLSFCWFSYKTQLCHSGKLILVFFCPPKGASSCNSSPNHIIHDFTWQKMAALEFCFRTLEWLVWHSVQVFFSKRV